MSNRSFAQALKICSHRRSPWREPVRRGRPREVLASGRLLSRTAASRPLRGRKAKQSGEAVQGTGLPSMRAVSPSTPTSTAFHRLEHADRGGSGCHGGCGLVADERPTRLVAQAVARERSDSRRLRLERQPDPRLSAAGPFRPPSLEGRRAVLPRTGGVNPTGALGASPFAPPGADPARPSAAAGAAGVVAA